VSYLRGKARSSPRHSRGVFSLWDSVESTCFTSLRFHRRHTVRTTYLLLFDIHVLRTSLHTLLFRDLSQHVEIWCVLILVQFQFLKIDLVPIFLLVVWCDAAYSFYLVASWISGCSSCNSYTAIFVKYCSS
jgi:hypothetical protein